MALPSVQDRSEDGNESVSLERSETHPSDKLVLELVPESSLHLSPKSPFRLPESMKRILPANGLSRSASHHSVRTLRPELLSCPLNSSPPCNRGTHVRIFLCKSTGPPPLHLFANTRPWHELRIQPCFTSCSVCSAPPVKPRLKASTWKRAPTKTHDPSNHSIQSHIQTPRLSSGESP